MNTVLLLTITVLFSFTNPVLAENRILSFGISPYASTSKLIKHQAAVQKHISGVTDINLSLMSAKDFDTYVQNVKHAEYDLIYSPPHLARYLEKKHGYKRVAMTTHHVQGVYLVKKNAPYQKLTDLKNSTISMASSKTILHQIALQELINFQLQPGKDILIKSVNTHNNAIYDVINDDSNAAVTGIKLWDKLPPDHKEKLRVLALTAPTSGFIILAKPNIDNTTITQLQQAFLSFNGTIEGNKYLFKGFKLIDNESMKSLDTPALIFE